MQSQQGLQPLGDLEQPSSILGENEPHHQPQLAGKGTPNLQRGDHVESCFVAVVVVVFFSYRPVFFAWLRVVKNTISWCRKMTFLHCFPSVVVFIFVAYTVYLCHSAINSHKAGLKLCLT